MKHVHIRLAALAASIAACEGSAAGRQCGTLELVPTPGQGEPGFMLSRVGSDGATAFAVGRAYPAGSGAFLPLLYRFGGAQWASVDLPSLPPGATSPVLMSVGMSAATRDTAWIVGYVSVAPTTNNLALILRWRNGGFDRVDAPALRPQTVYPFGPRAGFGYDVAVIGEDDVWVVGQASGMGDAQASTLPMALRWDGAGWTDVPTERVANRTHSLEAVSAAESRDVWAVGHSRNIGGAFFGLIERWDGSSWRAVDHPALQRPQSMFHDVLALADEVWVAGGVNYTEPLLYRWDGAAWREPPMPGPPGTGVIALAGRSSSDLYATTSGPVTSAGAFSVYHWNGAEWTEVPSPPPPPGLVDSGRGLAMSGDCDLWHVGSQMDATGFFGTFSERLREFERCIADFNGDQQVDFFDYLDFALAFAAGEPGADLDRNGQVDFFDYLDFVAAFDAGCE